MREVLKLLWKGKGPDDQIREKVCFWKSECQFCPDELLAEETVNPFLSLNEMIHHDRVPELSARRKKLLKTGGMTTPTLIVGHHALVGSEGLLSDFNWLKSLCGLER